MSLELTCDIGKPVQWDVVLTRAGAALELPVGAAVWFTVKRDPSLADSAAAFQLTADEDGGITFVDRAAGRIRLRATAAQSAVLSDLVTYAVELQVLLPEEDPFVPDDGRGTLVASFPVTTANA